MLVHDLLHTADPFHWALTQKYVESPTNEYELGQEIIATGRYVLFITTTIPFSTSGIELQGISVKLKV